MAWLVSEMLGRLGSKLMRRNFFIRNQHKNVLIFFLIGDEAAVLLGGGKNWRTGLQAWL
jgi:hypothetical protein